MDDIYQQINSDYCLNMQTHPGQREFQNAVQNHILGEVVPEIGWLGIVIQLANSYCPDVRGEPFGYVSGGAMGLLKALGPDEEALAECRDTILQGVYQVFSARSTGGMAGFQRSYDLSWNPDAQSFFRQMSLLEMFENANQTLFGVLEDYLH